MLWDIICLNDGFVIVKPRRLSHRADSKSSALYWMPFMVLVAFLFVWKLRQMIISSFSQFLVNVSSTRTLVSIKNFLTFSSKLFESEGSVYIDLGSLPKQKSTRRNTVVLPTLFPVSVWVSDGVSSTIRFNPLWNWISLISPSLFVILSLFIYIDSGLLYCWLLR